MFVNVIDGSNQQKRGVVLKLDPKTLGPVPVAVTNDIRSSGCLTSVSGLTSSVSSGLLATMSATPTTLSLLGSVPMSSDGHPTVSSLLACNAEASVSVAVPRMEDAPVNSTKGSTTLPTSLKSVAKESTNSSSKVIGKHKTTVQESQSIPDTIKTTSSSSSSNIGSKMNNKISATSKSESVSTVQTTVSNSKVDISGQSAIVTEDRSKAGTTVQVVSSVGNMVHNSNLPKPASSTAVPTCVTQLRTATINALNPSNTAFQLQQHFAVGSPTVGLIPSSGVSLPATIGAMPLPYYTSPTLGYPTYPFVYQNPDATSLIPSHPSASFIPAFSPCLSPRSPLSPRNIGGAKMLQDLPLQSNLLPLVPLVSQVPPQAHSPRPMTPPSPRTPTSNQSPRPYPSQSPRQSSTNHSRPQTPHSPKTLSTGHTRSPAQSPKLLAGQSGKAQLGSQSTQPVTQTSGTQVTGSSQSPNLASKLNACVQTSFSHATIMPKNNMSFVSSKPSVPLPTKNALTSQSLGLSQQVVSVSSCYPNSSQSPKPSRPKMPQSPKLPSSVGCTPSSETLIRTGSTTQAVRPQTPQFSRCSTPSYSSSDTRTTSVSTPRMAATSQDRLQIAVPQSPVLSMPIPVSQFTSAVPSGAVSVAGLSIPQVNNSFEGATLLHPQTLQVSLAHTLSALSQSRNCTGNTSITTVSKGTGNLPEVSSTISSYIPNTYASLLLPHNSVHNISPFLTTSCVTPTPAAIGTPACISAVPSCTSLTQNFPCNSNASCANPTTSPVIPSPGHTIPSSSAAEFPKVSSVTPVVVSVANAAVAVSGNSSAASSKVSVTNAVSTSCPAVTEVSRDTTRNMTTAVSVSSSINSLTANTCSVSLPQNTVTCTVPICTGTATISNTSSVTPPGMLLPVTSVTSKVEELPRRASSPVDVHKISVANTFSISTTASVAISPSITGSFAVPLNGTTDVMSSQCKTLNAPDSMAKSSLSQSSGVLNPSGDSDVGGKPSVMNARERGGNVPQPSACTPVCDVTHVIDAKLQCAEPSVSNSDGPRPCLKS